MTGVDEDLELELVDLVEPDGLMADDAVWVVPWLADLRAEMPEDATWPRLMTAPHPLAVDSLGREFEWWVWMRTGNRLKWWQRLVARRLLEVDANRRLVWRTLLLSVPRQQGKTWLMRELIMWRMHQGERFAEPQNVIHTSLVKAQAKTVLEPEQAWAKRRPDDYDLLDNSEERSLTRTFDGSKWIIQVIKHERSTGGYGESASLAIVDEAWGIKASRVDEALEPTTVSRDQAQLLFVSTAHRLTESLMPTRRAVALATLTEGGDDDLICEWSMPKWMDIDDVEGWRLASPEWSTTREQTIRKALHRASLGFASEDPTEPDATEAVRAQYLNQWPLRKRVVLPGDPLLADGVWSQCETPSAPPVRLWVAVEDEYGLGACVVAVALLADDQLEVDAWVCESRAAALRSAEAALAALPDVPGRRILGATIPDRSRRWSRAGAAETRTGLPHLRTLLADGRLVHDPTPDLDEQLRAARVRRVPTGGLALVSTERSDLVRALAWALLEASARRPVPAIH